MNTKYLEADQALTAAYKKEFGRAYFDDTRGMIEIPEPLANPGDKVVVENYRRRGDEKTDIGIVKSIAYRSPWVGSLSWEYDIEINNKKYRIIVRDDSIVQNLSKK